MIIIYIYICTPNTAIKVTMSQDRAAFTAKDLKKQGIALLVALRCTQPSTVATHG